MDLRLSDDQRMIRESAEALMADCASSAQTRAAMDSAAGYDAGLWLRIAAELGWCAIPVAERYGGLGLGAIELAQIFETMGRHLLCSPYFATVALATPLLATIADEAARDQWLPAIASGQLRATAPMPGADDGAASTVALTARPQQGRWILDGRIDHLVDGASADLLLLPARLHEDQAGAIAWFAVSADAAGLQRQPRDSWDRTRRQARVELQSVIAQRIDAPTRIDRLPRALALSRLCLAAEQLGGAQACLDMTVAYTATRRQFGRSIAGFQAIKHRCATMMVAVEALRSTVCGAAALLAAAADEADADATVATEAALTLALAKDSYFDCAQEAIQLHGGVGFTWDYDPQLHLKRAQAGAHAMGTSAALRARLADELLA